METYNSHAVTVWRTDSEFNVITSKESVLRTLLTKPQYVKQNLFSTNIFWDTRHIQYKAFFQLPVLSLAIMI